MKIIESKTDLSKIIKRQSIDYDDAITVASNVISDIKTNGDEALIDYTKKFDKSELTPETLKVTQKEIDNAYELTKETVITSLKQSIENIQTYHQEQYDSITKKWSIQTQQGVEVGEKITPIDSVGCYVPGGKAAYPSTVLMTVIPAKIAGVKRIVVVSPPPIKAEVLVACDLCQVDEIYQVGGAQAVAALAYGTKKIKPVSKIVGPGNKYVTAAKMLSYGKVDIDMPAGPSEILIIADESANPKIIALDLLAQAEHDENAQCVLITTSQKIVEKTDEIINKLKNNMERKNILEKSINNITAILVDDLDEAVKISNEYAPEHLEIMTKNPDEISEKITHAGAIFMGEYSAVAAGDYATGANHVLPTSGAARFASQLSVRDYLKSSSTQKITKKGLENISNAITTLTEVEGLTTHKKSVVDRL